MDSNETPAGFDGTRLRRLREHQGLSRQELARKTEPPLSRAYIYLLEGDPDAESNPRRPSYEVVVRLAKALDVDPSAFSGAPAFSALVDDRSQPARPPSLLEAAERFQIPQADIDELASFSFRGQRPRTASDWAQLWMSIVNAVGLEVR